MKKRITSLLLATVTVLALCTPAFAASGKTARRWQTWVELGSFHYKGPSDGKSTQALFWQPAWLPEGWGLEYAATRNGVYPETEWDYRNGEETLSFGCYPPSAFSFSSWMDREASEKTPKKAIKIQGYPADFWQVKQESALAWEDGQGNLFLIRHSGSLTQAELEKIANSAVELTGDMPEYRLGWTPAQSGKLSRSMTMPGYVRDAGGKPDFTCFYYAKQSLAAPEGTPETVTVQGVEAQLWLGDQNAKGTFVPSSASSGVVELPNEKTWSTLIWTDPETEICFCIQGHKLSKETMLRMAKSVTPVKAAPKSGQPAPASKTS